MLKSGRSEDHSNVKHNSHHLDIRETATSLVKENLKMIGNDQDRANIQTVVEKVIKKVLSHRNVYNKEASNIEKQQLYLEARYELVRE